MMKSLITFLLFIGLSSCQDPPQKTDYFGNWELYKVVIDGLQKDINDSCVLVLDSTQFVVVRESRDLIGSWQLQPRFADLQVKLSSGEEGWFNSGWSMRFAIDTLVLSGLQMPHKTTHLYFQKRATVPRYSAGFKEGMKGRWYLTRLKPSVKPIPPFLIEFGKDSLSIFLSGLLKDKVPVQLDERHRQVRLSNGDVWVLKLVNDQLWLKNEEQDRLMVFYPEEE